MNKKWDRALLNFPIPMVTAYLTTIMVMIYIEKTYNGDLFQLIASSFVGFLLSLVITQYIKWHPMSAVKQNIWWIVASISVTGFYFMVPATFDSYSCFWVMTLGLIIVLHILVGLVPFLHRSDNSRFINYNTELFVAWWQTTLLSLVLYGVLSLCILALEKLFGIKLFFNIYTHLFILVIGIFHTSYFLSEVPGISEVKPKFLILKVLLWYVMVPSLYIYGGILIAFMLKSLFVDTTKINDSIILIMWYAFLSTVVWLLLKYFDENEEVWWVSWFRKKYYIFSFLIWIALLANTFISIKKDGITMDNYFWAASTIFLMVISTYYIFYRRTVDYRIWPVLIIFIVLGLTLPGPLSFCKVPKVNQQHRLLSMLEKNGFIKNEVFVENKTFVTDSLGVWNRTIDFLSNNDGLDILKALDKHHLLGKNKINADTLRKILGLYYSANTSPTNLPYISIEHTPEKIELQDWKYIIPIIPAGLGNNYGDGLVYDQQGKIKLIQAGKTSPEYDLSLWLVDDALQYKYKAPKLITIEGKTFGLVLMNINASKERGVISNLEMRGYALVK